MQYLYLADGGLILDVPMSLSTENTIRRRNIMAFDGRAQLPIIYFPYVRKWKFVEYNSC